MGLKAIKQYFHKHAGSKGKSHNENMRRGSLSKGMCDVPKQLHLSDVYQSRTEPNSTESIGFSIGLQSNDSVLNNSRPKDFQRGPTDQKIENATSFRVISIYVSQGVGESAAYPTIAHENSAGHSPVARVDTGSYPEYISQKNLSSPQHSSASVRSASRSPIVPTQSGRYPRNRTTVSSHPLSRSRSNSLMSQSSFIEASSAPVLARETAVLRHLSEATPRRSASLFSAMNGALTSQESIILPQQQHNGDRNRFAHLFPENSPRVPMDGTHTSNYRVSHPSQCRTQGSTTSLVTQQLVLSTIPSASRDRGLDISLPPSPLQSPMYINGAPIDTPSLAKGQKPKKVMKSIAEKKPSSFRERLGGRYRVQFEETPIEYQTFDSSVYDRKPPVTSPKKDSMMRIYRELMTFKLTEMLVHPDSLENTNKHLSQLNTEDRAKLVGEIEQICMRFIR
ncbi:hypothetical protein SARC_00465 [Sphaeroforma arctica JP610]|uniref:Uncharacterized protein n=1 Tax=Sphaeroforma arctica JP610 TaxID=667725 RepID=A0A0L0GGH7_9EUKA|nr:hypothetical protein SARC_00465 [Sphaeroforma arctica JP610]KNC87428.1 hypothetical protein SARC_00465 [Sphaeroforma arctica JP610]|eukprot:XP_014161330.1 hypothetical protein SARC_00465 [Sphaeroforma arctica JP610]